MMRIAVRLAWFPLALVLAASGMPACGRSDPESRLHASLRQIHDALETRDARAIEARLDADFVGPEAMDRDGAVRLARVSFLRYRNVGVSMGPPDVSIRGDRATVRFDAVLTGGSGGLLPEGAGAYSVESGWRYRDGEWRVDSLHWVRKL